MFHYCVHLLHFTEGVAYKRIAVAWARSPQHRESNIHLRCRSHNQYAADLDFGASYMAARPWVEIFRSKSPRSRCITFWPGFG